MSSTSTDSFAGYDMLTLSYTNSPLKFKYDDNCSMDGFSLGYIHGFSISNTLPMFIETGVKLTGTFHSDSESDDDNYEYSASLIQQNWSVSIPLNYAWKLTINDKLSIKPFVGLNFKGNIYGGSKLTETFDDEKEVIKINWYDKDDMGGKNGVFRRFQMGWHIGAGVQYYSFYFGINYGTDFIKINKNTGTSTLDVSVGYCF